MTRGVSNGRGPEIHVVDDDDSVRLALKLLLRSAGFRVEAFGSAEEYLASDSAESCLVLDVRLPGMSGIDLLEKLIDSGHEVHPVFITARPNERDRSRALADGAVDYLEKPFDQEDFLAAVRKAVGE